MKVKPTPAWLAGTVLAVAAAALLPQRHGALAQISLPFKLPQNLPASVQGFEQKATEEALGKILDNELPLKLDATTVYPTVATLPGGPFQPTLLQLSSADLDRPLPPGDYTVNALAFCTEYSVHQPGAGTAYELAPLQGRAVGAITTLLWRGTTELHRPAQQLQAVSWAIQSGLRYEQMPKPYQAVIDSVIPEYKGQLNGNFLQHLQDTYQAAAKATKLPPLEQILGGLGQPGQLGLSAMRQQQILLRQDTTDQLREQTLFRGQESGVYKPVKAEEGPWSERIAHVAYMRYRIVGGNMASNNVIEIRILSSGMRAWNNLPPGFVRVIYGPQLAQAQGGAATTPRAMLAGTTGVPVGRGAQILIPVPVSIGPPPTPLPNCQCGVGNMSKQNFDGTTMLTQANVTNAQQTPSSGAPARTPYTGVPLNSNFMTVIPDYCEGSTIDGIMFVPESSTVLQGANAPAACRFTDMSIRQFVQTTCTDGSTTCNGVSSYPSSCHEERNFGTWYLDACASAGGDGKYGTFNKVGLAFVGNDEPTVNIPPGLPGAGTPLTKNFYDVVMCGNTPLYAFKWTRTGQPNPQWCKSTSGALKNITTNSYSGLGKVTIDSTELQGAVCNIGNGAQFTNLANLRAVVGCH